MSNIDQSERVTQNPVITGLETKLANSFQLGQGMMEELLTGKIRLI